MNHDSNLTRVHKYIKAALPRAHRTSALFDPLWIRYPMDLAAKSFQRSEKRQSTAQQLRMYLGPEKEYPERFTVEQIVFSERYRDAWRRGL
jgi:hypothetical protein